VCGVVNTQIVREHGVESCIRWVSKCPEQPKLDAENARDQWFASRDSGNEAEGGILVRTSAHGRR